MTSDELRAQALTAARKAGRTAGQQYRDEHAIPTPPGAITEGSLLSRQVASEWHRGFDEGSSTPDLGKAARGYEPSPRSGMISLDLPEGLIEPVPGGVTDHHITVVYLGSDVDDEAFAEACARARAAAAAMPGPLVGAVAGIDEFGPSAGSDGMRPAYAPVALPGVEQLRTLLEDLSASEHSTYHPHVTLAYLGPDDATPDPLPRTPVEFTHLSVHRGDDEVVRIPLGPVQKVDTDPAATERLMRYWAEGEGAAKIGWGVPGDFDRCRVELGRHVEPGEVDGLCANLHHRATGAWPGHAPGEDDK